jgi:23S rRNA (cytidine1920-2'-O)/16S rRNA (cytidine1409-2'-O)-methyltransferase
MSAPKSLRADLALLHQGLAQTRCEAQALIMAGKVFCGTQRVAKPSSPVSAQAPLVVQAPLPYVSRGGEKLAAFLDHFGLLVSGGYSLDVGASTGGFTDCLLQRGVVQATCVDVGHGQLHYRLRNDPRVVSLERVNARYLQPSDLPCAAYTIVVVDVSFISLRLVLPVLWPLVAQSGALIALIKPQFEASPKVVSQGRGVIRDAAVQDKIRDELCAWMQTFSHARWIGVIDSPLLGAQGNREFLAGITRQPGV